MKHNYSSSLRRTLSAVVLLLVSTLSWAADFEAGGICYNINSDGKSVEVTSRPGGYSRDIVIPSTVVHEGKRYSVTGIGKMAFYFCLSLASISFPESLTSIGGNAFYHCGSLTSIAIPEGVTSIGKEAFRECTSLASISFPESLTSIGGSAFWRCTSLASISLPKSLTSIEGSTFFDCSSLTVISIPEGVTSIGTEAFRGCTSLASISLPESLTSIESNAFYHCGSLTSIAIPEGVTSIGTAAFRGCTSLALIDIPSSVTSIKEDAFRECTSLTTVICRAEKVPETGFNVFTDTPIDQATLYVPASSIEDYKAAIRPYNTPPWKDFGTILPLEDYETGIDTPSALQPDDASVAAPYYTLGGQRVNAPVCGHIYIRSGRKVIY